MNKLHPSQKKKAISPLTPIPQPRIKQNENLLVPNRLFLDLLLTEILTSPRPSGGLHYWEVRSRSGRVPTDLRGGAVLFIKGPSVCLNGASFPPGVGGRARELEPGNGCRQWRGFSDPLCKQGNLRYPELTGAQSV